MKVRCKSHGSLGGAWDKQRVTAQAGTDTLSDTLAKRLMCSFLLLPSCLPRLLPALVPLASRAATGEVRSLHSCAGSLTQKVSEQGLMNGGARLGKSHHSKRSVLHAPVPSPSHTNTHRALAATLPHLPTFAAYSNTHIITSVVEGVSTHAHALHTPL